MKTLNQLPVTLHNRATMPAGAFFRRGLGRMMGVISIAAVIAVFGVSSWGQALKLVILEWDYPEPLDGVTFQVFHSLDVTQPLTNWEVIATVATTNATIPVVPGKHFFTVRAVDNFWSVASGFSNVTNTPGLPGPATGLKVRRP